MSTPSLRGGLEARRIAVLPLANISSDPKDEYFADGMTEELISTLSKVAGLKVIARSSVMSYKGTRKTVPEIANELSVGTILEGSVRKAGSKVRITAQLVDPSTQEQLWSQEYDRSLEDVFAIQSEIAQHIARQLRIRILRRDKLRIEKKATSDLEAYAFYLKGRHALSLRTEESLNQAIRNFKKALGEDPSYALAYTGLADSNALMALFEFLPPSEAFPRASAAAEKALELDGSLAEAHTSLGIVKFQYDWDWPGAEKEFRLAIGLNPNLPPAHQYYSDFLKGMGRLDESLAQMRMALALDPLSLAINSGLGHVLYLSRQYDRAIEQYSKVVRLDPGFVQGHLWFGRPYLQKGMFREAVSEIEKAVALSAGSTMSLAMLGHALASAGKRDDAKKVLDKLLERSKQEYVPSYWIAMIHVGFGDKENAFAWIERAFRERSSWLAWVKVEPRFDPLRPDPRFKTLLERMRLNDDWNLKGVGRRDLEVPVEEKELGLRGWLKGPRKQR